MRYNRLYDRFRAIPISTKTLVSHVSLALVVVLMMGFVFYVLGYAGVQDRLSESLEKQARQIAAWCRADGDLPDAKTLIRYGEITNARVFIITKDLVALRAPEADQPGGEYARTGVEDLVDRAFLSGLLSGNVVSDVRHLDLVNGVVMLAGAPILDGNGTVRAGLVLAQPISVFRPLSSLLKVLLLLASGFSILLATLIGMLLTSLLVRPIRSMTKAARSMADGAYDTRITPATDDELGELAQTLNTLCGRMGSVIEQMREDRDKLELVISGIGEGLIAVDPSLRPLHENAALLELLEEPDPDFFSRNSPATAALRSLLSHVVEKNTPGSALFSVESGRRIYAAAQPLTGEDGGIEGAVCLLRDVSEQERMEQIRRDYVANVSHELRTPLTGIRGMVEPLIDGCMETEEEKQSCYRVIYDETMRLEKLVREMLYMSRLQDGRLEIELETLDAGGILSAAISRMKPEADKAGILLSLACDSVPLLAVGNEDRILQTLIIFLDNALSFTPSGGQITVFGREEDAGVVLGVRDTGVGIEQKDLPFIWERFYKADKSRLRTSGTGLGLAIAKLVVEHMQGTAYVKSERGRGSEFGFSLRKP